MLFEQIYSVLDGVAHVFVQKSDGKNINDSLVEEGFADFCEEDYRSKVDNAERRYAETDSSRQNAFTSEITTFLEQDNMCEPDPPPPSKCTETLSLKGPLSPLVTPIFAMTSMGLGKTCKIDRLSVNSVLLNNNPQVSHAHHNIKRR